MTGISPLKDEDIKIPLVKQEHGMNNDTYNYFINLSEVQGPT